MKEKRPAVSASALCELLRRQLSPQNTVSAELLQLSVNLSLARFPLFHRTQVSKWVKKWTLAMQVLDARHNELCGLPPIDPLTKPSSSGEQQKRQLLQMVDQAIFDYVAVHKKGLFEHPLIRARISLADGFADRAFFERLALAIRRGVGGHGRVPWLALSRAATMLEQGESWDNIYEALTNLWATDLSRDRIAPRDKELYEALVKAWGADHLQPEAFYKQLKRHGLIQRRGQKT